MEFNYNDVLREKIASLQKELGLSNFDFEIDYEQAFLKTKDMKPNTIYILTKNLQSDISIGVTTQPVQIFILSEQNSLDVCKALFQEFARRYNFQAISQTLGEHNIWVKQQYSDPVVLSNFNVVDYGYRSVLYISATLYIMYDVVDVKNVKVDNVDYIPLSFNFAYSMSTNTQQQANKYISTSKKTVSTFAITMTIPMVSSVLITKVMSIIDGTIDTYDGDNGFVISFECGLTQVIGGEILPKAISKTVKMISAQLITAPNAVPSLQLGFLE